MFSRGLESSIEAKLSFLIFGTSGSYFARKWCILGEISYYLTLKQFSKKLKIWWCQHYISKLTY